METLRHPKFVRWALMLGIVVILNIFFTVLVALVYPAPQYEAYCPITRPIDPADAAACDAQGGIWNPAPTAPVDAVKPVPAGFCDLYTKCQIPYQEARDRHALSAFVLMIGLGILALVAGLLLTGSSIVSSGLSYGGVLAFVSGSVQYWGTAGNWIRLAISAVGLIALLAIGWRRFRD